MQTNNLANKQNKKQKTKQKTYLLTITTLILNQTLPSSKYLSESDRLFTSFNWLFFDELRR